MYKCHGGIIRSEVILFVFSHVIMQHFPVSLDGHQDISQTQRPNISSPIEKEMKNMKFIVFLV